MVILKFPRRIKASFRRHIGIDYSGAETPASSLKGFRVYEAGRDSMPVEVEPPPSPRKYWTRRGLAEWLEDRVHFWPLDGRDIPAGKSALVEVYPSLWNKSFPRENRTSDQHDAYVAAAWLRQADQGGTLVRFLEPGMLPGEYPVARVEGWILCVI